LNKDVLKKNVIPIIDEKAGTLNCLELYLDSLGKNGKEIIKKIKCINRLRQSYPIHRYNAVEKETYDCLKISFPIENHNEVWKNLLIDYRDTLKILLNCIKD
jgi:hypothetical protein